jgi:23S rRNA (uridine2552-2'-O)-methyltransferase
MPTRWYQEKKQEHFYKQAKQEGYRARSAFKLLQIQKKFRILKQNNIVIDLGAAPGGWSQVVKEIVGKKGKIIGIDILNIQPLEGIIFLKGDMTKKETIKKILNLTENNSADVVLSDMSPDISGNYNVDQARSIFLCEQALKTCDYLLKSGGSFVCKAFEGEDFPSFYKKIKNRFRNAKKYSPRASRKSSSEIYIIGKDFKDVY